MTQVIDPSPPSPVWHGKTLHFYWDDRKYFLNGFVPVVLKPPPRKQQKTLAEMIQRCDLFGGWILKKLFIYHAKVVGP